MPGRLVAGEGTGGLEAVEVGHHHVHQDQVGQLGLGGFDPAPSVAVRIWCPSFSTMRCIPNSCDGESSTIRMRAMLFPCNARSVVRAHYRREGRVCRPSPACDVQSIRTTVRPSEPPASIRSNTAGRPSRPTSAVQMRSRCCGFQSLPSRDHTSSRSPRGALAEDTPSSETPRRMNGITVMSSVGLAARPALTTLP